MDALRYLGEAGKCRKLDSQVNKVHCLCFSFDVWSVAIVFSQKFCKNGLNFLFAKIF